MPPCLGGMEEEDRTGRRQQRDRRDREDVTDLAMLGVVLVRLDRKVGRFTQTGPPGHKGRQ